MEPRKAFNQLAYQLIYPAVLGSIIFDLADPFRDMSEIRAIGFLIGLCFIVDYLHMTLNLCKDGTSPLKYGALLDIIIALLFCLSYFSLSRATVPDFDQESLKTYLLYSLGYISLAQFLIYLYEIPMEKELKRNIKDSVPLIISVTSLIVLLLCSKEYSVHILFISMLSIFSVYTYRVIQSSSNKT